MSYNLFEIYEIHKFKYIKLNQIKFNSPNPPGFQSKPVYIHLPKIFCSSATQALLLINTKSPSTFRYLEFYVILPVTLETIEK